MRAQEEEEFGGGRLTGKFEAVTSYVDNFYYRPEGSEQDARGLLLSPSLTYLKQDEQLSVRSTAAGSLGFFDLEGNQDDYRDGSADVTATLKPSVRHEVQLALGARRGHDPFGFDRTESAPSIQARELDIWSEYSGRLRYSLGAPAARLGADLSASVLRRTYETNTEATRFLDRRAAEGEFVLRYRLQPKTSLIANAILTRYDFDERFSASDLRNGELRRARVGVQWSATARTTGDIRVGYRERSFDDSPKQVRSSDWDAGVAWTPPRIKWEARSGRYEQASYLSGVELIDVRYLSSRVSYRWTPLVESALAYQQTKAAFVGQPRQDDFHSISASVVWQVGSKLALLANAAGSERNSQVDARDFERFSSFIGLRFEL